MPTIRRFANCKISIYADDHLPAHFHVEGRGFRVVVELQTMAVRAGDHVLLRGQTGTDLNEKMHGAGDAVAQADQAMENVGVLLNEAGAGMTNVTKATVFVTDRAYLAGVTEVVQRRLAGVTACFSALVVKGLASPELLMEVDVTAVKA